MFLFRSGVDKETIALVRCYIGRNFQAPAADCGQVRYSIEVPEDLGAVYLREDQEARMDQFMARVRAEERLIRKSVDAFLDQMTDCTFSQMIRQYILRRGLRDSDVYRAANMDRRLFSKIVTDEQFHPAKDTALALVFALHLTLPEADDLLRRAGYALSHSDRRDLVMEYFIRSRVHDLPTINMTLEKLGMKIIGR